MSVFIPAALPITFQTVAEMIRARLPEGAQANTSGYRELGDGGSNKYFYRGIGRSALPAIRGGLYIAGTAADDYYEACDKTIINPMQYGATYGRSADVTDLFWNMTADCVDLGAVEADGTFQTAKIVLPHGDFRIRYWSMPAPTLVTGAGYEGTFLIAAPNAGTCDFTAVGSSNVFTTNNFPWLNGRKIKFAGGSLPTGIVAERTYYVTESTFGGPYDYTATTSFKVSEFPGGAPIDITSDGSGLAIHGVFITDRWNAAKITPKGFTCWGNIKQLNNTGWDLETSDPDYQSPYVESVFDLGPTETKGLNATLGGAPVIQWGSGAEMVDVNVYFWKHSIAFHINSNICKMDKCWSEQCGQNYRMRGNGWGATSCYATGNRGVAFQEEHSISFSVEYPDPPTPPDEWSDLRYMIWGAEPVPLKNTTVYFIGDDLPMNLSRQTPYYVRTDDALITGWTANPANDTIVHATHGMQQGFHVYFNGASLPTGIQRLQRYYVVNAVPGASFQISLTKDGSPATIDTAGSGDMYYFMMGFQVCEIEDGVPVDLGDAGSGVMKYSSYSTSAVDVAGGCVVTDLEIEAPFGDTTMIVDGSPQLQCNFNGVYVSLDNQADYFTASAATDQITRTTQVVFGTSPMSYPNGSEIYLDGEDIPGGLLANRRYFVVNSNGTNIFQVASTLGGAALPITLDGSGTIAFTPKPNSLIRWRKSAGSLMNPRVSPGARGYANFGIFRTSDGTNQTVEEVRSVAQSPVQNKGPLIADSLVLPNLGGYAVLTAEMNGVIGAARVPLNNWHANFNGTDNYIRMGRTIELTKGGEYTYSWACTVRTLGLVMAGHSVSTDSYLGFFIDATHMRHNSYNNSDGNPNIAATLPTACNDGAMHHYVLRRMPGDDWAVWQDGTPCVIVKTGTLDENFGWIDLIGRRGLVSDPLWFDGQVDFLRAWDRGLTDTEVDEEFAGNTPPGVLLAYEFTDAAGDKVKDFGSSNNVGTFFGTLTDAWVTEIPLPTVTPEVSFTPDSGDSPTNALILNLQTRLDELVAALVAVGIVDETPVYYGVFDGTDDFITLGALSPHPVVNSTNYTFAWKGRCSTPGRIIAGKTGDDTSWVALFDGTTGIWHKPNGSAVGYIEFTGLANTAADHHYVLIRNGNGTSATFELFQDGVKFVGTLVGTVPDNTCNINFIGKRSASDLDYHGRIYSFKAWDRSLSDAEAYDEYAGLGTGDAVLDLRFTEGSGTTVADSSATNNDGTVTGMTWGTV